MQENVYLEQLEFSPAFMITDSVGLRLVSCDVDSHGKGSKLQFFQLVSFWTRFWTRFCFWTRSTAARKKITRCCTDNKNITNEKPSYNCHQFRLIELSGNFNSWSTVRLTKKRRWEVTNLRLADSEAQILGHRGDQVSNISR